MIKPSYVTPRCLALTVALLIGLALPAAAQPLSKAECRKMAAATQGAADGLVTLREATETTAEVWVLLRERVSTDLQRNINKARVANGELQRILNKVIAIYDDVAQGFRACSR